MFPKTTSSRWRRLWLASQSVLQLKPEEELSSFTNQYIYLLIIHSFIFTLTVVEILLKRGSSSLYIGCVYWELRHTTWPWCGSRGVWLGKRGGLLDCEELVGCWLGWERVHKDGEKSQERKHRKREMWDRDGGFIPNQDKREPTESRPISTITPSSTWNRVWRLFDVSRREHLLLRLPVWGLLFRVGMLSSPISHLLWWPLQLLPPWLPCLRPWRRDLQNC